MGYISVVESLRVSSTCTCMQCAAKAIEFDKITQNNGHYAVQGSSRSLKIILKNFRAEPPPSVDRPKIILFLHGTTSEIILKNFRLFQCFILTWNHV